MSLVEEEEISAGQESNQLSKDPIQESIVKKSVMKDKPTYAIHPKTQKWKSIFNFDKTGMTDKQVEETVKTRAKKARMERGSKSLLKK